MWSVVKILTPVKNEAKLPQGKRKLRIVIGVNSELESATATTSGSSRSTILSLTKTKLSEQLETNH